MRDWKEAWIARCVHSVPDSAYRRRLTEELGDHLESLAEELEETGLSPCQAQDTALARAGDPEALAHCFRTQWLRHVRSPRYVLFQLGTGCLIIALSYLAVFLALGMAGVTYDASPGLSMTNSPRLTAGVGGLLFLLPFSLGAVYLTRRFQGHTHPSLSVLGGLLLAWLGEKAALYFLSALLYQMPLGQPGPLLTRMAGGGDPTAPWFTPAYILLTLCGCGLLGSLVPALARARAQRLIGK